MSVDVESWVHRPIFHLPLAEQTKELDAGHVLRATRIILDLFKTYRTKATFFVLGTIAEWYPELIKDIQNGGHDIGIHGYTHTRLIDHTRESFNEEIKKTIKLLNRLGVTPRGYRSPAFSRADFMYEVLNANGLTYDSSVFPLKTPLYDGSSYDCHPFVTDYGMVEIPCSVLKIAGFKVPAGGFYLRLLGGRINYMVIKKIEEKYGTAVMYLHPWEILDFPGHINLYNGKRIQLPFLKKMFAYYRIPAIKELEYLLGKINFINFQGAMGDINKTLNIYKGPE